MIIKLHFAKKDSNGKNVELLVSVIVYVLGNILQDIQQVVIICLPEITTHRQVVIKFNTDSVPLEFVPITNIVGHGEPTPASMAVIVCKNKTV